LFERMLGVQRDCVNVGEVLELFRKVAVGGERCGCGEPFADCPFWTGVGQQAFGGWSADRMREVAALQRRVGRQRHVPRLLATSRRGGGDAAGEFARDLRALGVAYARLYAAIAEVAAARVVVDASKWPGHGLALARSGAVDLRVVHLVRDVRGVAYSWAKSGVVRPQADGSPTGAEVMATHGAGGTALRWSAFQLECDLLTAMVPHSTRVRYEDLVRRPRRTVETALGALGLDEIAGDVRHIRDDEVDLPASHGLAGNPSRFTTGQVRLRPDDQWREAMPIGARRLVTALASPVLLTHGYALRAARP
jgi:hypothetical protein